MKTRSEVPNIIIALVKRIFLHLNLNWRLGDIARTTLMHSDLPLNLWSYAYQCACYLVNQLSNQQCKTSPIKQWSSRLPSVTTFYPFGSRASVHVPKEQRKKLEKRGWTGYLVGYQDDKRGWFFWNPSTQKIINSEVLHLGQEKTKEICEEQDSIIDSIQAISDADIPTSLKNALKSPAASTWKSSCLTEWKPTGTN